MSEISEARREYGDLIDRPHPVSRKHFPMSRLNRAAQFSPFAALTGYDDLITESARETDARRTPDEGRISELDRRLRLLFRDGEAPEATFTWFVPDGKKAGGKYVTARGRAIRCDRLGRTLTLADGTVIPLEDLWDIDEMAGPVP